MESDQTLHSFVLSMLTDQSALTAFVTDPEGALNAAGLGDISAADVHDVIPMVIDYAPAGAVAGLESALGALPVDSIDGGQAGAIQQLQFLASTLTQSFGGHFALDGLGSEATGAVAGGLDGITGAFAGSAAGSELAGSVAGGLDGLTGAVTASGAGSELAGSVAGGLDGLTGAVTASGPGGAELASSVAGGLDGFSGSVAGGVLGHDFAGAVTGSVEDGLHGTFTSPLGEGSFGIDGTGVSLPTFTPAGDLADTLDSATAGSLNAGSLTSGVETAASTAAALATGGLADPTAALGAITGGDTAVNALTGQVESVAATSGLPAALPQVPAIPVVPEVTATASSALHEATAAAHAGISEATGALSQIPGATAVAGHIDQVTHLVNGAVSEVSSQLPAADALHSVTDAAHAGLAEATSAVSQSPVGDVAGASGVTGVVNEAHTDVTGLVHSVVPDVHLPF